MRQPFYATKEGTGSDANKVFIRANASRRMVMHSDFVLIDLISQRNVVRTFLDGVDIPAHLEWIRRWGTLETIEQRPPFPTTFVFESRMGLRAGFYFDLIGSTKTNKGLKIKAKMDEKLYEKGKKITDEELNAVNLEKSEFHGEWNYKYKIKPQNSV